MKDFETIKIENFGVFKMKDFETSKKSIWRVGI